MQEQGSIVSYISGCQIFLPHPNLLNAALVKVTGAHHRLTVVYCSRDVAPTLLSSVRGWMYAHIDAILFR